MTTLPKAQQREAAARVPSLLRVERCRHSVEAFARTYFPEMVSVHTPEWHFEVDRMVEDLYNGVDDKRALILAAPRGHGKTARLSQLHTLHALLYERERFIVLFSATDDLASETLAPIKHALETNDLLRQDFGNLVGAEYYPAQTWNSTNLVLTWPSGQLHLGARSERPEVGKTSALIARGVNSRVRGLRHGAYRPTLVLADDLESPENIATQDSRATILNWLYADVMPMLDPNVGKFIMVGTVLHFDSLLAKMLKREDVYHTKVYRAIKEDNTPLWPERFSLKRLEQIRAESGSRAFAQEYMNNPMAEGDRVFQPEWFKPYTADEVSYDEHLRAWTWRGKPLRVYQGIDPAISERERADDFSRVTVGVSADLDIIVFEASGQHLDFPSQIKAIEQGYEEWAPFRIEIEEIGYQRALRQQVLREKLLPVKPINAGPVSAKSVRITAMDTLFEAGHVYIRKALPDEVGQPDFTGTLQWRIHHSQVKFFEQALIFPDGAHDDILDAFQIALQCAGVVKSARAKKPPVSIPEAPPEPRSRSRSFTLQD